MDFSKTDKTLGSSGLIWYPASGFRDDGNGGVSGVGGYGYYWSVSPSGNYAYSLIFSNYGSVYPARNFNLAYGLSVRCLQE